MVRSRRRSGHSALRQTPVDAHEHMRDSLTEAAFLLLLQGTRGSRYRWRPTAMLLLAFSHGLRVSALCNLKDKDLALAHGRRWIARLTGSLSTAHPLCTEEWRALKRSLPQRGEVQLPWLSLTERGDQCTPFALTYLVRVTSERAGVGWRVHPHMLRQGCGYALAKRGDDLRVIHDDLGHRAPTHTTRSTPTAAHRFEGLWEEASGDCPVPQHAMPAEAVRDLRRRLAPLPPRSPERRRLRHETARRYGVSDQTRYRVLRQQGQPRAVTRRMDRGVPRGLPPGDRKRYLALIAAVKRRTTNRQGRPLSTGEAMRLLEDQGLETPEGWVQAPKGVRKIATVHRDLPRWGLAWQTWRREPPAVRFPAQHSHALWQCARRPSDRKQLKVPPWLDPTKGPPTLLLQSGVDDRSGVAYQEQHGAYGEDVETALTFLGSAMAPKADARFPFWGRPHAVYVDHGPVARSQVLHQVMGYLDIEGQTHLPRGPEGRHPTARAKGKGERPFRTVKDMQETLQHCHEPQTEDEAKAWRCNVLLRSNDMPHRSEPQTRLEDGLQQLPPEGLRAMGSWERFCPCARAPERRQVGIAARVSVAGVRYEVDADLAGATVMVWFGLYDDQLSVEQGERRDGPQAPSAGPIPLHRYRRFKKTPSEQQADRLAGLAAQGSLPRAALSDSPTLWAPLARGEPVLQPFADPDPVHALTFPSAREAQRARADHLGLPLATLAVEQVDALTTLRRTPLAKPAVWEPVRPPLEPLQRGADQAP